MNEKERKQLILFEKLKNKEITQVDAARELKISTRWVRKKFKRYINQGDSGLIHRNRGKESEKRWNKADEALSIDLLKSDWLGFGPTFAVEKLLQEKGIKVSRETLRKAMMKAGIHHGKKKKSIHRQRRERRKKFGQMIQLDGSLHLWFEDRGEMVTLLVFIDDATSKIVHLAFAPRESCLAVMQACKDYFLKHGIPSSFYVDYGSVFSVNLNNAERDKKTQWQEAMQKLGVEIIHANSPQAKGRVERVHSTLQDRLVKELRLANISSIEQANAFLCDTNFIEKHNEKFSVSSALPEDAHRSTEFYNLDQIFCIREKRRLANDFTISYKKQVFQLTKDQKTILRPKNIITVNTHLDRSITLSIRSTTLNFAQLNAKPKKSIEPVKKEPYKHFKRSKNSKRWVAGLPPLNNSKFSCAESRVKPAEPAVEAL